MKPAIWILAFALSWPAAAQVSSLADLKPVPLPAEDSTRPPVTLMLYTGEKAKPIAGWSQFCEKYAAECVFDLAEPETIELTPENMQAIDAVNLDVNRHIKPVTDKEHWGVEDRWDLAEDGSGDCEDIQLVKRKLLVEKGFPRRALRITVVIDELGAGHAVLMVRTDKGEWVLDNKNDYVLPWQKTGYLFIKREGHDSTEWVSLQAGVVTATAGQ